MEEFLEAFMWINYPTVNGTLSFVFKDIFINICHIIVFLYVFWRFVTVIWAGIFKEQIGVLYGGSGSIRDIKNGNDWEEWNFEFWLGWLFLDNLAAAGLIIGLPFIIYGLLYIWPLWVFIGVLFGIKWAKDYERPVKPLKPTKQTSKYEQSLMKGLNDVE